MVQGLFFSPSEPLSTWATTILSSAVSFLQVSSHFARVSKHSAHHMSYKTIPPICFSYICKKKVIVGWCWEEIEKHVIYPAWKGKWHIRAKVLHNSARTHTVFMTLTDMLTSLFFNFLKRLSFQVKPVDTDLRGSRFFNHVAAMKLTEFLLEGCIFASGNVMKCSWLMTHHLIPPESHQNTRLHDLSGPIWGFFCCKGDSTVTLWLALSANSQLSLWAKGCLF